MKRQLNLTDKTTFRVHPTRGDYLLWIRCTNPWSTPPEFNISDFWEFREGDRVLITNSEEDYPAAVEQMESAGPSVWKILAGDRLAWIGFRPGLNGVEPQLLTLINCCREGYAYGEPQQATLDSVMTFGTPTSEFSEDIRKLWMLGYDAVVALGLPRTLQSLG